MRVAKKTHKGKPTLWKSSVKEEAILGILETEGVVYKLNERTASRFKHVAEVFYTPCQWGGRGSDVCACCRVSWALKRKEV